MTTINNTLPPNFPTKPTVQRPSLLTFPSDLTADRRNMYMQIQFIPYSSRLVWDPITTAGNFLSDIRTYVENLLAADNNTSTPSPSNVVGTANPVGGIVLPIPMKLNDIQPVVWSEVSLMDQMSSAAMNYAYSRLQTFQAQRAAGATVTAVQGGAAATSVLSGLQINPMLWMMFKTPGFKEFSFQWQLMANNEEETQSIANIKNHINYHMLPNKWGPAGGLVYQYPSIALIKLYPVNTFTIRFKPCAVLQIEADYTGGGMPSFFKNGAPTMVNMSMTVKEIDLWTKDNYWS